jgi:catechol 2,3-dioxygenase-like lactoylglutathione lyase family enzyme
MSTTENRSGDAGVEDFDMKLEVLVVPVSDVDRAKEFYSRLGWRLDVTPPTVVQFTPHGSGCSVQFGASLTSAAPGSAKGYLIVSDIVAARDALVAAGVDVDEIHHLGPAGPVSGLDPERRSYFSRASFSDPDGNSWLLQEITTRLPGRVEAAATSYGSASDLADAMRRAEAAHGEHEKRTGQRDANWPDWYAAYMVAEQTGAELPL